MSRAVLIGGLLFVVVGCTKDEDYLNVVHDQRAAWKEMADILETVKDEVTLASAKKALEERRQHYDDISRRANALPKPPPPSALKRMEEQQYYMKEAVARLAREAARVQKDVPGGDTFIRQFQSSSKGLMTWVQP